MEERHKAIRICDELVLFMVLHYAQNIQTALEFLPDGFLVTVQGNPQVTDLELSELADTLKVPRNPSLEDYYEELLGTNYHESGDFKLIGMMVDEVDIAYDQEVLQITCLRRN